MSPFSAKAGRLAILVLLLFLCHPQLQVSLGAPRAPRELLSTPTPKRCIGMINEIICKLTIPNVSDRGNTDIETRAQLQNKTLWWPNMCEFLRRRNDWNSTLIDHISSNLEQVKLCLPKPEGTPKGKPVIINNFEDFRKKLNVFMMYLSPELSPTATPRPVLPTSDPVTPQSGMEAC